MNKEKLTSMFMEKLTQWENDPQRMTSGYEYEKTFVTAMKEIEEDIFREVLVEESGEKGEKKLHTSLGEMGVNDKHILMRRNRQFRMSGYLQELSCYAGQAMVYQEAAKFIERYLMVELNGKQIERVCHFYGEEIEQKIKEMIKKQEAVQQKEGEETHYVMVDGVMTLTRKEKWQEMKLGRVFKAGNRIEISSGRKWIAQSKYMAHLGEHQPFEAKMATLIDNLPKKIFICDGAKWIWNWIDAEYPESLQILDYYHAKEHLCHFAEIFFEPPSIGKNEWIKQQEDLLFNDDVEIVISNLRSLKPKKKSIRQSLKALINYYEQNKKRMRYKTYKSIGLMIGSGPIEAANRHVIQHRMKRSGQRWTKEGLQQLANLRVADKSDEWDSVTAMINKAA